MVIPSEANQLRNKIEECRLKLRTLRTMSRFCDKSQFTQFQKHDLYMLTRSLQSLADEIAAEFPETENPDM